MDDLSGYLKKKANDLNLGRAKQLLEIQAFINDLFPDQCRAKSLNNGVLRISTQNSSVANELRFRAAKIKARFPEVKKVIIGP